MTGEPDVVELTFAAALSAHDPTETGAMHFVTPAAGLKTLGADWALDLQAAVQAWRPDSRLTVDATLAPGFGLYALEQGLFEIFCPSDHPAFSDLSRYATEFGGRATTHHPAASKAWHPKVPTGKSKDKSVLHTAESTATALEKENP